MQRTDAAAHHLRLAVLPGSHHQAKIGATGASGAVSPCNPFQVQDYGSTQSVVGASYSSGGGLTIKFTYGKGASSSLGVGVSSTEVGGFSASGTKSVSTSGTETFPIASGVVNRAYSTDFDFREYEIACYGSTSFSAQPVSWYGGTVVTSSTQPSAGHCVPQLAGSTFNADTTKASTFSAGVSIASKIGINLSADTGYTTTAGLFFSFVSQGHPLCGVNGFPGSTNPAPGLLTVHPTIL